MKPWSMILSLGTQTKGNLKENEMHQFVSEYIHTHDTPERKNTLEVGNLNSCLSVVRKN